MAYTLNGVTYSSKKHPMLEFIFKKYNPNNDTSINHIDFTLKDISDGYRALGIPEPASISNTILDLTRKRGSPEKRLPKSICDLGYDLVKKTGKNSQNISFAGSFIFVGVGNQIQSWLVWSDDIEEIEIDSNSLPFHIRPYLRNDEGALFSVIDYCDVLSKVLFDQINVVMRVQNPMKWQPNEIDGFYFSNFNEEHTVYPVEAKALTTADDINLVQLRGGVLTIISKLNFERLKIQPLAVQMVSNGIRIAVFNTAYTGDSDYIPIVSKVYKVSFNPPISTW
jgi:hypothetical protein